MDTFTSQKRALDELWNELVIAVCFSAPLSLIMWAGSAFPSPSLSDQPRNLHGRNCFWAHLDGYNRNYTLYFVSIYLRTKILPGSLSRNTNTCPRNGISCRTWDHLRLLLWTIFNYAQCGNQRRCHFVSRQFNDLYYAHHFRFVGEVS